jgi:hypothetical protein
MQRMAQEKQEKSEKRKKRKGSEGGGKNSSKKKTKGNSGQALKAALVGDAKQRVGEKAIFVQPPNLSEGCYLKDYQLEVSFTRNASLLENRVVG